MFKKWFVLFAALVFSVAALAAEARARSPRRGAAAGAHLAMSW